MIRTLDQLTAAMFAQMGTDTPATLAARVKDKADPLAYLARLVRTYFRAQHAAPALGLVGVGCISFAEARLVSFQRRAARKA